MLSLGRLATTVTLTSIFVRLRRGHWQNVVFYGSLEVNLLWSFWARSWAYRKISHRSRGSESQWHARTIVGGEESADFPRPSSSLNNSISEPSNYKFYLIPQIFMSGTLQYRWDVGTRKTQLLTTRNQGAKTGMGLLGPNPACRQFLLIKLYWHIVTFIRFVFSVAAFTIQLQSSCSKYIMAFNAPSICSLTLYRMSLPPAPTLGGGWASVQTAVAPVRTEGVSTRTGLQGAMEVWRKRRSQHRKVMDQQTFRAGLKEWVRFLQLILQTGSMISGRKCSVDKWPPRYVRRSKKWPRKMEHKEGKKG